MAVKPLNSKPIEEIIISSILSNQDVMMNCISELTVDDFNDSKLKDIYQLILELYSTLGRPIGYPDVLSEMIKRRMDINIIADIQNNGISTLDINDTIKQLKDIHAINMLTTINNEIDQQLSSGNDWYDICVDAIDKFQKLEDDYSKVNIRFKSEIDIITNSLLNKSSASFQALTVGYPILNTKQLFVPNSLIFVASSPKSGKTRLISSIIKQIIELNENVSVLWFSMEDSKELILRYLISLISGVPDCDLSGKSKILLTEKEFQRIYQARDFLKKCDITIIDEPLNIQTIQVKFTNFCNKRKNRFNILLCDNFNIVKDMMPMNMSTTDKETYIASKFQNINTINNRNGKISMSIIIDHLSKDNLRKQSLNEGYRPRLEQLKGSGRKYEIATQLVFLNRPSLYDDLVAEEILKSNLIVNGYSFERKEILKDLLIMEIAANRHDGVMDESNIIRFNADFLRMDITEYPQNAISVGEYEFYEERNITYINDDVVRDVMKHYGDNDFNSLKHQLQYTLSLKRDINNNTITVDYLLNKYAAYVESLRDYQNGAYTKKGKDIVNFDTFLNRNMYEQNFEKTEKTFELSRNSYLYGV